MKNKERIKELERRLDSLCNKVASPSFLSVSDADGYFLSELHEIEEKLNLLFDYLDVRIKNEPAKEYLVKRNKKKS